MIGFKSYFEREINVSIYHRANNAALLKKTEAQNDKALGRASQLIQISCHAVYDMFYLAFEENAEGK